MSEIIELKPIAKHPGEPVWEIEPGIEIGFDYLIEGQRIQSACKLKDGSGREFVSTRSMFYPSTREYECIWLR